MAYAKGTDAAGGGSNVNTAWVNKVAEEKWAAEQEEKRRKERVEDAAAQRREAEDAARSAEAQKQEQLAARKREQEQAAAQKAAQEEAARKAAQEEAARSAAAQKQEQLAARQRAAEQAAAQKAAQEQAARENAARQAEAQRQEQLAARQRAAEQAAAQRAAEQQAAQEAARLAAEEQARREEAARRAAALAAQQRQRDEEAAAGQRSLSYSGAGAASPTTQAMEAQWFPAANSGMSAEQEAWLSSPEGQAALANQQAQAANDAALTAAASQNQTANNYRVGTPGNQRYVYRPQTIVSTPTTTQDQTAAARTIAAGTRAALGADSTTSGALPEWLQEIYDDAYRIAIGQAETPAAAAQIAAQRVAEARAEAAGEPRITMSSQPMSQEERALVEAANNSMAAAEAARNYRVGTPGNQRYVYTPTATAGQQGSGGVTTPTFGQVLQGLADDFLLGRNGGTNPGNEVIDNYRNGTPGNQRYDARYPRATTAEQEAYIYDPNTGPTLPETPSFGDVLTEMMGRNETERTGTAQDLTYGNYVPPSQSYEGQDIINPNAGRNSSGEWKAIQQEDKYIREGYAEAQKMSGWTERDRRDYAMYYAEQKKAEDAQKPTRERTWQEELRARREGKENGRPGAANALDEIMNGTYNGNAAGTGSQSGSQSGSQIDERTQAIIDRAREAGLTWSGGNAPGASGRTVSGENTMGIGSSSQNGTESGSGGTSGNSGTSTSTARRSGEERAEKKAPKGSVYFNPSYGQQTGKGVKLPYKAGGYSENEIMEYGNKTRGTDWNGKNVYEGYYYYNGKYYPIDQEKAAYYKANGNSYKGWEEPMREYYQTFGTYYGYRPDWKIAGGKNVWKANNNVYENYRTSKGSGSSGNSSSSSLSYTPAAASSGRSYGRGSTANNGMYWNGNTSWSI